MDLRSAWMPAPPEGSVPAMERTLGTLEVPGAPGTGLEVVEGFVGAHAGAVGCSAMIDNPFASSN